MIKFTVKSKNKDETYTFFKKEVLIGSSSDRACDLVIAGERIQPEHLRIEEEAERFIVKNSANDPFATLNDLPFGKRIIKNQDVIAIGDTLIIFEGVLSQKGSSYQDYPLASTQGNLTKIVEAAIEKAAIADDSEEDLQESFHKREETPPGDSPEEYPLDMEQLGAMSDEEAFHEMNPGEMESLMEEWQEIENEFQRSHPSESPLKKTPAEEPQPPKVEEALKEPTPPPASKETPRKALILDLSDNEQEPLPFKTPGPIKGSSAKPKAEEKPLKKILTSLRPQLKIIGITFAIAAFVIFLIIAGSFWKFNKESEKKVIEVSRSVSDIALAMTYAQIHHITPHQHNWSNPQFLKTSVSASLSPHHATQLKLEGNGKLNDDYLLRIYTNRDNSRFVIIAQPEPSLFHYLTTPDSIVVDSAMMTLRRINDLKALNRLLIDQDQLHSPGNDDVAHILNKAEIIPMDLLADADNRNGFKTPDLLKVKYPGAENYIYNSPRYSRVGERIMSDAVEALSKPTNTTEMRKLKEVLLSISRLPYAVMYTTKGKEHAEKAKMAISSIIQNDEYLLAYINYDEKKDTTTSYLLVEEEELAQKETPIKESSFDPLKAARHAAVTLIGEAAPARQGQLNKRELDPAGPLFKELNDLSNERRQELEKIHSELDGMISREIEEPGSFTIERLEDKARELTEKIEGMNTSVMKKLYEIYSNHKDIPLSEFLDFVERSGLRQLAANELFSKEGEKAAVNCNLPEEGKKAVLEIEAAVDFDALFASIAKASAYFSCDSSEDPQQIITFQNRVKGAVIEKLNEFILEKNYAEESAIFTQENRKKLSDAMKKAWIFDQEEQNYYLAEFVRRQTPSS